MAKVRHVIHLDQDVDAVLRERAARLRMPPAVLLRGIVSHALAGPSDQNLVSPEVMPVTSPALGVHQEPLRLTVKNLVSPEDTGCHGEDPGGQERSSADHPPILFSSLGSDPEEKKKNKRPILTEEQKKARAEGKAKKEEADRLFDQALELYAETGGTVEGENGDPVRARRRWHDLRTDHGYDARDLLARLRRFIAATKATGGFWPGLAAVLLHRNNYLTDMGLAAREKRAQAARQRAPGAQGAFDGEAHDERLAHARRSSQPLPRPSPDAVRTPPIPPTTRPTP